MLAEASCFCWKSPAGELNRTGLSDRYLGQVLPLGCRGPDFMREWGKQVLLGLGYRF